MLDDINNQLSIEHLQVVFQTIFDVRDQPHFVTFKNKKNFHLPMDF